MSEAVTKTIDVWVAVEPDGTEFLLSCAYSKNGAITNVTELFRLLWTNMLDIGWTVVPATITIKDQP
jgi:hypothetical protein